METFTILSLIGTFVGGGALVALIQALFARGKTNAETEVTLSEGWEKFAQELKREIRMVKDDNAALRKELSDISAAYFDQQRTILRQHERISEQEAKIAEQQTEIDSLREELQVYRNPVTITPATV